MLFLTEIETFAHCQCYNRKLLVSSIHTVLMFMQLYQYARQHDAQDLKNGLLNIWGWGLNFYVCIVKGTRGGRTALNFANY